MNSSHSAGLAEILARKPCCDKIAIGKLFNGSDIAKIDRLWQSIRQDSTSMRIDLGGSDRRETRLR
jgi:hypothetical protein